jgi:hypothetical protein
MEMPVDSFKKRALSTALSDFTKLYPIDSNSKNEGFQAMNISSSTVNDGLVIQGKMRDKRNSLGRLMANI